MIGRNEGRVKRGAGAAGGGEVSRQEKELAWSGWLVIIVGTGPSVTVNDLSATNRVCWVFFSLLCRPVSSSILQNYVSNNQRDSLDSSNCTVDNKLQLYSDPG